MKTNHKGKQTVAWRAHKAALRLVPVHMDRKEREQFLDYLKVAWARGYAAARYEFKPRRPRSSFLTDCDM